MTLRRWREGTLVVHGRSLVSLSVIDNPGNYKTNGCRWMTYLDSCKCSFYSEILINVQLESLPWSTFIGDFWTNHQGLVSKPTCESVWVILWFALWRLIETFGFGCLDVRQRSGMLGMFSTTLWQANIHWMRWKVNSERSTVENHGLVLKKNSAAYCSISQHTAGFCVFQKDLRPVEFPWIIKLSMCKV